VSIAVYFLMTTFIVAVLIRLAIRLVITRALGRDDYVAVGATVRHMAQDMSTVANWISTAIGHWTIHCSVERRSRWPGQEAIYT
jgi:Na+-driven multidrug efflux pump